MTSVRHTGFPGAKALAIALAVLALVGPPAARAADGGGTTYYVSARSGDDANAGTDQAHPWKTLDKVNDIAHGLGPGDSVLLERGSVFSDQCLHIKDTSGSADAPITIGSYGDESLGRPVIAANGVAASQWQQDYRGNIGNHKNRGTVSTALLLKDVSHITVRGIEITNDDPAVNDPIASWSWTDAPDTDGTSLDRSADRMDRTGVAGIADNGSTMSHVTLDDLYIHDVDGNIYDKHMANGGIYFMAHLPRERASEADDTYLQSHISRFDGITIKNSTVADVDRWGIAVGYTAFLRYIDAGNYGDGQIDDALIAKYGSTNVRIENNYVTGAGGDAITVMYCDRPEIVSNVGDGVAKHINTQDYTEPGSYGGRVAAGIWPWRCKDARFERNEMYRTLNNDHGNGDGQPWDADYGDGTLYQYNYSAGNSFATIMVCNPKAVNTTFRYNIAQNDNGALDLPANGPNTHIYNNTFYLPAGAEPVVGRSDGPGTIENNIFINAGAKRDGQWNPKNKRQSFNNNLYVNYANAPESDTRALRVDDAAAVLEDAGSGPAAASASHAVHDRAGAAFEGYRPVDGSAAIGAGASISDANGYAVDHDFFGTPVGAASVDLGAVQARDAASLADARYETGREGGRRTILVPFTQNAPTTAAELLGHVTPGAGTQARVLRGGTAIADDEPVREGDVLSLTKAGADGVDFEIVPKTSWSWVDDFTLDRQGPIWHGQVQDADGTWSDIADIDPIYPNWAHNTFYGPGVDYADHALPADRSGIHGLLSDDPKTAGATAMSWQAPKDGTVRLSLPEDEPYLRQAGNAGAVTLSVYRNGELLHSAVIEDSLKRSDEFAAWLEDGGLIDVADGDWVRVTLEAAPGTTKPSVHVSPTIAYQDPEPTGPADPEQPGTGPEKPGDGDGRETGGAGSANGGAPSDAKQPGAPKPKRASARALPKTGSLVSGIVLLSMSASVACIATSLAIHRSRRNDR